MTWTYLPQHIRMDDLGGFAFQDDEPVEKHDGLLWLRPVDGLIRYWYLGAWRPITGAEDPSVAVFGSIAHTLTVSQQMVGTLPEPIVGTIAQTLKVVQAMVGTVDGPATSYRDLIVADSPISYWRLGETSGSVVDEMGAANGTVNGTITRGVAGLLAGDPDTAYEFPGGSGHFIGTGWSSLYNRSNLTVEAWIKISDATGWPMIAGRDTQSSFRVFQFRVQQSTGVLNAHLWNSSGTLTSFDTTKRVDDGVPHHVAVTVDGTTARLYIDGVQEASTAFGTMAQNTAEMRVGGIQGANTQSWRGVLDEVAFYNYALSASQIAAHHTAGI
jgi:hypothetical protein